jgi:FlaA1/EpsC-like NDP-sugar epimerase
VTRQQNFFGRIVAAGDIAALMASYLIAYTIRRRMWELAYPVLPIGSARGSAWIITVMFPAWLLALRYFHLYNPITYRSIWRVIGASIKAQVLASVLMLNAVFIIRGFDGVSRPLLALIIMASLVTLMAEKLAILFLMRYRWRLQRRSAVWRVLLVGSRDDAENYLELVRQHPEWNLKIVDVVPATRGGMAMRH